MNALSLRTLRVFCQRTLAEMCQDLGAVNGGVQREEAQ